VVEPIAPYGCAEADIASAVASDSLSRRFVSIMDLDPDRPDIATNSDRMAPADALQQEIDTPGRSQVPMKFLAALDAAGVPAGGIRTIPPVYDWEQVRESMVLTLPHPTLDDLDVPGSPLRLSEHAEQCGEAPPALGVDPDDVFADYVRAGSRR
jgi:crotonobetainyl-CoA:carnitine CoA-transferase CaiB-like acyl-CoA transferase